jgi:hypothetical protein
MPATITLPKTAYPRPPLLHQRDELFLEPRYRDGELYAEAEDAEDEDGERVGGDHWSPP